MVRMESYEICGERDPSVYEASDALHLKSIYNRSLKISIYATQPSFRTVKN